MQSKYDDGYILATHANISALYNTCTLYLLEGIFVGKLAPLHDVADDDRRGSGDPGGTATDGGQA